MAKIFTDNSQSIGGTPLIKLNRITAGAKATVLPDSGERYLSSILFEGLFNEAGLPVEAPGRTVLPSLRKDRWLGRQGNRC